MLLIFIFLLIILLFVGCISFLPVNVYFILHTNGVSSKQVISVVWGFIGINVTNDGRMGEIKFLLFSRTLIRRKSRRKPRPGLERAKTIEMVKIFAESLPYFPSLVKAFIKTISISELDCNIKIGFSNPVDTGFLYGYFKAFQSMLSPIEKFRLSLNPVFNKETMEGQFNASFRIKYPIKLLVLLIRLFTKKPVRQLMRIIR